MTIKNTGGVFGRNPTFNSVTSDGDIIVNGNIGVNENVPNYIVDVKHRENRLDGVRVSTSNNSGAAEQGGFFAVNGNATGIFAGVNGASYSSGGIGNANEAVLYGFGNVPLVFGMNTLEAFRITTARNLDLVQGGGNIMFASGAGIDFSATSGTGTSELFDDYEEGTWTPSFTASGGGSASHSRQNGRYTKIGNTVFAYFQLSASKGTLSGNVSISGLPFTSLNLNGLDAGSVSFNRVQRFVTTFNPYGHVTGDSTSIGLFKGNTNESTDATTDGVPLDAADLNTASTFRNYCFGVAIYHTA